MTIRQWIRRRTPDHCSSPGGGCGGGAADASLSAHGLAATAAAPPLLLLLPPQLLPASLVSNGVGGPLESAYRRHRGEPRGEGEGGQPGVVHDGNGHSSEAAEEEEEEAGGRLQLLGWGSRPAGMKVGCPSGVAQRCGCG